MKRKKLLKVCAAICIGILAVSLAIYFIRLEATQLSWLAINYFVVYKQDFAWVGSNATEYMFWNVTGLNGDLAYVHLVSHGVDLSNGTVILSESDIALTLNTSSREVISLSNFNSDIQVGSKWPFWIPTSVKDGDPVETIYGNSYISPSQTIDVIGVSRNCWVVSYAYSVGDNMDRFYDTKTGICLSIQTHRLSQGISVNIKETAIQTNINSLI